MKGLQEATVLTVVDFVVQVNDEANFNISVQFRVLNVNFFSHHYYYIGVGEINTLLQNCGSLWKLWLEKIKNN